MAGKFMTLSDLEKSSESSVWVLNNTNPKGMLSFLTDSGMGSVVTLNVPLTWIPFDLTTQATKTSLISNPQFRRVVSGGLLQIVSQEYADSVMQGKDAQDEMRRVFNMEAVGYTSPNEIVPEALKPEVESAGVSGFIIAVATSADLTYEDAIADIRRRAGTLSTQDLTYLQDNSVNDRLKAWAKSELDTLAKNSGKSQ